MKSNTTKPPLERFQRIAAMLSTEKNVTASVIASKLEVCPKTVYRDLEFMRDRLGLPIETTYGCKGVSLDNLGFHFTEPVTLCACCSGRVEL